MAGGGAVVAVLCFMTSAPLRHSHLMIYINKFILSIMIVLTVQPFGFVSLTAPKDDPRGVACFPMGPRQ